MNNNKHLATIPMDEYLELKQAKEKYEDNIIKTTGRIWRGWNGNWFSRIPDTFTEKEIIEKLISELTSSENQQTEIRNSVFDRAIEVVENLNFWQRLKFAFTSKIDKSKL